MLIRVRANKPDVIILDVIMPKMDGWEVLKILRENEDLNDIPVIMSSSIPDLDLGAALGAQAFIPKPINIRSLYNFLDKHITNYHTHILVVEDDTNSRSMIVRTLKKQPWKISQASNGREAIENIEKSIPDIILLDLMMPEMDGFEVVKRLRAHPQWCKIPLIIITAKELTMNDLENLSGNYKIINKGSFGREDLLKSIVSKIDKKEAPDAKSRVG